MTLQVDAQDNLDVGLKLCDLSSPFHRVRSSNVYENEHLYSLHVSDSLMQFMYSLCNRHKYTEYGCRLVITLSVYQRLDLFLLFVLEASWNSKLVQATGLHHHSHAHFTFSFFCDWAQP